MSRTPKSRRVLVAGATGYLGRYVAGALHERGHWVRALSRSPDLPADLAPAVDDLFVGEVTRPETLKGVAEGVDVVISSIGITRQKDGLTYEDVDYRGNLNLLDEASASGAKKFIYVSVLHANRMADLKIIRAKERFVDALRARGIDYAVIRPNGFFSDMREILEMARRGRVYLFGDGSFRGNPIHGRDVAEVCVEAMDTGEKEIGFGGPKIYTHREMAEAAFAALDRPAKITALPVFVARAVLFLMRLLTPVRVYGPVEFQLTVLTRDMVGPARGTELLSHFFSREAGASR